MKVWCEQCGESFDISKMINYKGVYYCKECNDDILYLRYTLRDVF